MSDSKPPRAPRAALGLAISLAVTLTTTGCSSVDEPTKRLPQITKGAQPVPGPGHRSVLPTEPLPGRRIQSPQRPNLVMITVDDASVHDLAAMPHVQELLVDQGTSFDQAIAPSPICVPARASLLTGQYAHNHGALTILGEGGGAAAFEDSATLPVWLQSGGYQTIFVGKYLNGYGEGEVSDTYVPPGWTSWNGTVDPTTYNFFGTQINHNGRVETHEQYSSDLLTSVASQELATVESDKPFYLWLNYVAPHHGGPIESDDPLRTSPGDSEAPSTTVPAPEDKDTFSGTPLRESRSLFEADVSDKTLVRGTHKQWDAESKAQLTEVHQQRLESLQSIDRGVAQLMSELEASGELEDTYVVFNSDNGYVIGEHNLTGKLWHYQDILRVPTVLRGPGVESGAISTMPISQADWPVTFAALAGVTPTRKVDGIDVLPWVNSRRPPVRVIPIEAYPVRGATRALYRGVMVNEWTYVRNARGRGELYNRAADPDELHNLIRDPRYRKQRRQLARLTEQYSDCAGSQCPQGVFTRD